MAVYVKYEEFIEHFANKELDFMGGTDDIFAVIHSDAPVVATDNDLTDLTQVTGTGYTAGGADTLNTGTRSGAVFTVGGTDVVWTATAADWTAGRYVSIYDTTVTTPVADVLIAYWDYGSNFTLGNGETFTLDFGASIFTMT